MKKITKIRGVSWNEWKRYGEQQTFKREHTDATLFLQSSHQVLGFIDAEMSMDNHSSRNMHVKQGWNTKNKDGIMWIEHGQGLQQIWQQEWRKCSCKVAVTISGTMDQLKKYTKTLDCPEWSHHISIIPRHHGTNHGTWHCTLTSSKSEPKTS